jgi:hypothetical protein
VNTPPLGERGDFCIWTHFDLLCICLMLLKLRNLSDCVIPF